MNMDFHRFMDFILFLTFLFLGSYISEINAQWTRLSFGIIAPRELSSRRDSPIRAALSSARRVLSRIPGGFPRILTLELSQNSPGEILDIFCNEVFPNNLNSLMHLDIKDDRLSTRSTDYLSSIADQLGYPLLSWNPDYAGSLENNQNSRVIQMAPTLYHQSEAMMTLMSHYNWTHFVVITTTDVNHFDFVTSVKDIVKKNNEYTGYPKKQRFYVLSEEVFEVNPDEDFDAEAERMKKFLKNTPKDNRIFLLHSSSSTTKGMIEAAEEVGLTGSQYMWILTSSSVGILGSRTSLPLGLMGVTFRDYKIIQSDGKITTSTDFNNMIKTAVSDSLRMWGDTMNRISRNLLDPKFQNYPNLLCNVSTNGSSAFWEDGGAIYEKMKETRITDRDNLIDFTDNGMNKFVRLTVVNVKEVSTRFGKSRAWQKVGQYLPVRSGRSVRSVIEMDDITWPGNNPFPPKGKPDRRHFSIATRKEEPFVMYREVDAETGKCVNPSVPCRLVYNKTEHGNVSSENGTVMRCCAGLSIDLLRILSDLMEFDYDLFEAPDRTFGVQDEITGQWNGLIGLLQEKKADMAVTALTVTPKRVKAVDFTVPYLDTGIAIMVSYRDGAVSTTAVLEPYDSFAWALILIFSVHSIGAAIYIFEWLSPGGLDKGKVSAKDNNFSLFRSFWLIWAMLFGAAVDTDNPRGIASRFMANIWALFALMFIASYTANLAAFMITKEDYYKLSGIHDWRLIRPLDHDPPFRFATVTHGSTEETVKATNEKMFEYMQYYNKDTIEDAVEGLKNRQIQAFIYDATPLYYQEGIDKKCQLKIVGNWYARTGYSVGFPKGSTELIEEMNQHILRLQDTGELERLRKFWLAGACHAKTKTSQTSQRLEIPNFTSAFILLAAGIVYGAFLLAFEHLYFRFGRKFVNQYDQFGFCSLVSLSMGRTMTLGQTVMEAIDFRKTHRCADPLCENKLWNVRHELDVALLRLQKVRKEKAAIENKMKSTENDPTETPESQ